MYYSTIHPQIFIHMCISRTFISRQAGCRHWLDVWSDPTIPVCVNGEEFVKLTEATADIASKDFTNVKNFTGCLVREAFKKKHHFFCDKCHTLGGGFGAGPCHKKNHSFKIIFEQF